MERSCNACMRGPEPQRNRYCIECGDDMIFFVPLSQEAIKESWNEERIEVIAQNGNDGLHYQDMIVESVRKKLLMRTSAGIAKYGTTLERSELNELDWLNHLQEELMDAVNYLEVLIQRKIDKRN